VSSLLRFLGLAHEQTGDERAPSSVRRIAGELERLDPESARFLAAFACVLARVAGADLRIEDDERAEMERRLTAVAELSPEEARIAIRIARAAVLDTGATENYLVTREFRRGSTRAQRLRLLECLFEVAAADGTISSEESREILAVAEELGFARSEVAALRTRWRDRLSELQSLPR
jgi:uncharacterized tellurite resistance protein B-like protein